MTELEAALDPGFKGGQVLSCGNCFWESVPLRDGAGEEGQLPILGSVEGLIKGAGVGLAVAFLLVPCSWHVLGVYRRQTVPEFAERAEVRPFSVLTAAMAGADLQAWPSHWMWTCSPSWPILLHVSRLSQCSGCN